MAITKEEFYDEYYDWCSLYDFCQDHGFYDFLNGDSVIYEDSYNEAVEDDIREFLQHRYWYDGLAGILEELPTGYEYYQQIGTLEYVGLDSYDLDGWMDQVCQWGLDSGDIVEEEEEEEDAAEAEPETQTPWPAPQPTESEPVFIEFSAADLQMLWER